MKTIAITDSQNNAAFFYNLLETLAVADSYKQQTAAIIYPIQKIGWYKPWWVNTEKPAAVQIDNRK
jgi:hypothetical protein